MITNTKVSIIAPWLRYSLFLVGLVQAITVSAHSVEEHDHHLAEAPRSSFPVDRIDGSEMTIAELIKDYSLSGDDSLIELGWNRVSKKLDNPNPNVESLLEAAWILQAQHKFDRALSYAEQVLLLQPNNSQAWLLTASIFTVQGKPTAARAACQKVSLALSPIVSIACSARLTNTEADQRLALGRLQRLLLLEDVTLDSALKPWVQSIAADLARNLGEAELANEHYLASINTFPSVQVRAAYADLLLTQKQYHQVIELIKDRESTPALRIRRLMAEQGLGHDTSTARNNIDLLFRSWAADNDFRHAREMAMFYLELETDLPFALHLASKNIQFQREPEDQKILQMVQQRLLENTI